MENTLTTIMMLTLILVPIIGILMAVTPYLMRKNECFAVTVPESALHDPYLKSLKRRYASFILLATAALTVLGLLFCLSNNGFGILAVVVVGALGLSASDCDTGYCLKHLSYNSGTRAPAAF